MARSIVDGQATPDDSRQFNLATLREMIQEMETSCQQHTAEITEVTFSGIEATPTTANVRYLINGCNGMFREQTLIRDLTTNQLQLETLRVWDGERYSVAKPKVSVKHRRGELPVRPVSLPFGIVLEALGFAGTLSDLLTESTSIPKVRFELEPSTESKADFTLRRFIALPGAATVDVIELELCYDDDSLKLISAARGTKGADAFEKETTIDVLTWHLDDARLDCSLRVSSPQTIPNTTYRLVSIYLGPSLPLLPDDTFTLREFAGNPTIMTFDQGKLIGQRAYYADEAVENNAEAWTPLMKWLVINDVMLAAVILANIVGMFRRRRRQKRSIHV